MRLNILIIIIFTILFSQERTFNLKDGNKITGIVINIDENGNYIIQTDLGELLIKKDDIKLENVKITTKNGDTVSGKLINEDMEMYYVKSNIGTLSVEKNNILSLEFIDDLDKDNYNSLANLSKSDNLFYFGDEQLIDLWFDPTGNILDEGTIYLSGLSGAYGASDK